MSWVNRILPAIGKGGDDRRASVPEGLWKKCVACDAVLYRPELEANGDVCPKCDHHMRIGARRRIAMFLDEAGKEEIHSHIEPVDRLKFRDKKKYKDRLAAAQKATGEKDALVAYKGKLNGHPLVVVAFEFNFHGGSMGGAVGEKFTQAANTALQENIPMVCFSASGGARMQEALISLMQMAKTSAVLERMKLNAVPYISVMTDPIYGGVSASLALLGDINIAEPGARAGFAGPNIIEQTIRQKLPPGFQRSEFLLEHGAIDMIVHRGEMRPTLTRLLGALSWSSRDSELPMEDMFDDEPMAPPAPAPVPETLQESADTNTPEAAVVDSASEPTEQAVAASEAETAQADMADANTAADVENKEKPV